VGDAQLLGFTLDAGASTLPVAALSRRIEFIGDSITAGFGVDGPDAKCGFSAETENYSHSYAAATAQALGAEQSAISASGVGVYRNWGATTLNTAADLYERALPTQVSSRWSFGLWKPDVVVINLGTSDFTSGDPGSTPFLTAYRALVARVRKNNPSALIVIALGPMLSDLWPVGAQALTQARARLTALVAGFNAAGDPQVRLIEFPNQDGAPSFGCRYHPSAATHRQLADQLARFLRQQLGW
jgi:lysophospholipase L1-like esterase